MADFNERERRHPRPPGEFDGQRFDRNDHQQMVAVLFKVAHAADEVLYGKGAEAEAEDALEYALGKLTEIRPYWRERGRPGENR